MPTDQLGTGYRADIQSQYKYCPLCRGQFIKKQMTDKKAENLVCASCGFIFFLDPRLVACTIAQTDEGILLQQRKNGAAQGLWALPGGYVDRGETLENAARREFYEETGLKAKISSLVGTYSYPGQANIVIVFKAEITGGKIKSSSESMAIKAFDKKNIPWDQLAYETTVKALKEYLA